MLTAHIAALGAALCWAAGGLIAIGPVRAIGSLAFNRLRLAIVGAGLTVAASVMGVWHTLEAEAALRLAASALAGIVMGDLALFWSLSRLGPRRNVVIYATNAPLTALLGWLVLGETLGPTTVLGIGFVTMGVMLAVALRSGNGHAWEAVQGSLLAGVAVCLVAALGQATGSIIAKPAMATGVHPIAAAAVRTVTAAGAMLVLGLLFRERMAAGGSLTPRIALLTAVNGFIGVGMGATLIMVALSYGNAGVVATLSAMSPVLILPMLWALTRQRPGLGAWVGAAIAVAGVGLIVNR
ncbi:DMT family transporter [Azospirillum thermophilum]|uniref:EamA family transporter n=1 Tax=Azospirillum thermophilum TaxID=2202148 RepID=A0A2S2CNX5_9PROT|nr:DMT family transporter [Azospirillum thermophilum]AWK86149.1 EamA family transporter [Azospirillum thermophilum]